MPTPPDLIGRPTTPPACPGLPDALPLRVTGPAHSARIEAAQRRVRAVVDVVVAGLGVGEAMDFTAWLMEYARRQAGYAADDAGKPT